MKNKKVLMILSIITLISFIIGFSYAYFTTIVVGNDIASSNVTISGSLKLKYNGTNYISLENANTGDSATMTFTVTNSGTLPVSNYEIYFSELANGFINDEIIYELSCVSSDTNSCTGKTTTPVPRQEQLMLTAPSIAPGTTHTYTLNITFIDTGLPQDYNQEKILFFTIKINEMLFNPNYLAVATLSWDEAYYFWDYKQDITSVTFENEINIPAIVIDSWDVSEFQDGSIMAYIIDDELGTDTFKLYIQSNEVIYANPDSSSLFAYFNKLTTINNLHLLNTSQVTSMVEMFSGCTILTSLDLSSFNTSKVRDMVGMFAYCSGLTSLNLSIFNTANVENMQAMFFECNGLTSLDLSNFNTNNVTKTSSMFYNCSSLTSLNLNNHDFKNLEWWDTVSMFYNSVSKTNIITKDSTATAYVNDNWENLSRYSCGYNCGE